MKKILLSVLMLGLFSAEVSAQFGDKRTVRYISSASNGEVAFNHAGGLINPANCPAPDVYIIPLEYNAENALAVLLTAKASNEVVRFWVDPEECIRSRPVVKMVAVGHPY